MEQNKQKHQAAGYPIGVVARLTGIQPTTLRIWERRYGLVEPVRSEGRNRRYSDADVQRLSLIKTLVDAGHQISTLAPLTMDELQARLDATSAKALMPSASNSRPCRVAVLGGALAERMKSNEAGAGEVELVGSFADENELLLAGNALAPDVLIIEFATVHADAIGNVRRLIAASGARQAVVIYNFGSRQALIDLEAAGVACLRAPASLDELASACRKVLQAPIVAAFADSEHSPTSPVPPRLFTPEQLAHFANLVPKIACECPHHLVDLINSLSAFEKYSNECQNRNPDDAQIHAYLHQIAGQSRAKFERALQRVAEFEGIELS